MKYPLILSIAAATAMALAVTQPTAAAFDKGTQEKGSQEKGTQQEKPQKPAPAANANDEAVILAQKWSYPLITCPVSGDKLGAKAVTFVVNGRMVRTCSPECEAAVMKNPTAAIEAIDKAVISAQKSTYPAQTCVASGEKLDDKAVDKVVGTRLVRFCSAECAKASERDLKAVNAKLDEAYVRAQVGTYPLKTCVVDGQPLGETAKTTGEKPPAGDKPPPADKQAPADKTAEGSLDRVYGTTLVRFCSSRCAQAFEKAPDEYLKKLADARTQRTPETPKK